MRPNKNVLEASNVEIFRTLIRQISHAQLYTIKIFLIGRRRRIHLLGTYVFLGQDERRVFAAKEHRVVIQTMGSIPMIFLTLQAVRLLK